MIAATQRDLRAEVRAGRFRADLYFRLDVARLRLPPLRERAGDLPLLARALLCAAVRRARACRRRGSRRARWRGLPRTRWPGNVRELENALERLAIRCAGREARPRDVASALDDAPATAPALDAVLRACGGNVARAARALGLPRTTLRRRLARAERDAAARRPRGGARSRSAPPCRAR